MDKKVLVSAIKNFHKVRVLVIGDLIFDKFLWGQVERISPEAPVPVVWVTSESFMPGGAANVANNIATLKGQVTLCGVTGDDDEGKTLRQQLEVRSVLTDGIIVDKARPTTVKTRVIAHHQQVVRFDTEDVNPISDPIGSQILSVVEDRIADTDVVVIEDYGKGVVNAPLLDRLVPLCVKNNKLIFVDPKIENFHCYKGVTAITPNRKEAGEGSNVRIKDKEGLYKAGRTLLENLNCQAVLVTLGEDGMCLFEQGEGPVEIPTFAREVFDVSGAGDTVISAFALAVGAGASMTEAAHIANYAAGLVVEKVGISVAESEELMKRILEG
ncbi:MAG: D-glycero-beta-D-manno-heptose-7-phosphate kinase [Candidatus Omnitrophica bacterium]|nr:D-glycero-beta-D-manno-heptose-7-phosphate kinase [Candidatus Omnitrophota bacterium]